jgi:low affinity Fe/Cu permease
MIADKPNECRVHKIVAQNLNMRKVRAKMDSEILNDDQKARRNEVSIEMLQRPEIEPDFLNWIITGDESWFFEYDAETKRQS